MATHHGNEGQVKIGTNLVAEVQSWSLTHQVDTVEATAMGNTDASHVSGVKRWNGQVECSWDETDTSGQQALDAGASVTLNLYPEGSTTGDVYFSGAALVTEVQRQASRDSLVRATFSFLGNGALSENTVP